VTASLRYEETFASSLGDYVGYAVSNFVTAGVTGGRAQLLLGFDGLGLVNNAFLAPVQTYVDVESRADIVDPVGTNARAGVCVRMTTKGVGYTLRPVTAHTHNGPWELVVCTDDAPETYVVLSTFTPANVATATATVTAHLVAVGTEFRAKVYETVDGDPGWGANANCMYARSSHVTAAGRAGMVAMNGVSLDDFRFDNAETIQWDGVVGTSLGGTASTTAAASYTHSTTAILRKNRPVWIAITNTKAAATATAPDVPTMTGLTVVSAAHLTQPWNSLGTSLYRTTVFTAMASADIASATTLTVGFGGVSQTGCIIQMAQFDGAYALDSDGSDAFPNGQIDASDTGATSYQPFTLAFTNAYKTSGAASSFAHDANEATLEDSPWAELVDGSYGSPATGMGTYWATGNSTAPGASWTTSSRPCGAAAEVRRNNPHTHYGAFPISDMAHSLTLRRRRALMRG